MYHVALILETRFVMRQRQNVPYLVISTWTRREQEGVIVQHSALCEVVCIHGGMGACGEEVYRTFTEAEQQYLSERVAFWAAENKGRPTIGARTLLPTPRQ